MFVLEKEAVMKNVVFGVLATVLIAGCGTVGRVDAKRDSMAEFPGRSDMYLVERKVRALKFSAAYLGKMLSRTGADQYAEQIDQICRDSRSLRQIVDRLSLEMLDLSFELEEQERLRIETTDDKTLSRMKSLIIPDFKIGPGKSLKDAASILRDAARHPKHGDAIEIEFDLNDVVLGRADEGSSEDPSAVIEDEGEEGGSAECVYKIVPAINVKDISLYDAIRLVCEAIECSWDIRDGTIYVFLKTPSEFDMYNQDYPAPLFNPDRDWISWLSAQGIHMPQGSTIVYDRHASKLRVITTYKGFEIFQSAFPLIYAGAQNESDVR